MVKTLSLKYIKNISISWACSRDLYAQLLVKLGQGFYKWNPIWERAWAQGHSRQLSENLSKNLKE